MRDPWFFEVLPCRALPFSDECLSSYVPRLAAANGIRDLWMLIRDLFPVWDGTHQVGMLRWEYPVDHWGRLPVRSTLAPAALERLTILPWVAKFRTPPVLCHPFSNGPGKVAAGLVAPHAQICGPCVDEAPYSRLVWRFVATTACLTHGCLLQTQCARCQTPLRVIGAHDQPLQCANCQADWRTARVTPAPEDMLLQQQRWLETLRFLLDPDVTLVQPADDPTTNRSVPQALGLKFRALRSEAGWSIAALSRQLGVADGTLSALELGQPTPLPLYLTYLDALGWSWPAFAAFQLTTETLAALQTPPHMALRLCPTPTCPHHAQPSATQVTLRQDLPAQRLVRFHCKACRRSFTRRYDGSLSRKTALAPAKQRDPARVLKSEAEIQQALGWGRAGKTNRWIAQQTGWGSRTIRMYWKMWGVEDDVHQAQAAQQAEARRTRRGTLRCQLEVLLPTLLAQDRELSLRTVAEELGYTDGIFSSYREIVADLQRVLATHNGAVQARQAEAMAMRVAELCRQMEATDSWVTLAVYGTQFGMAWSTMCARYPEQAATLRHAVLAHQQAYKTRRREAALAAIDQAAARLTSQGVRLTQRLLMAEAGLSPHASKAPAILERLRQWAGSCPWEHG